MYVLGSCIGMGCDMVVRIRALELGLRRLGLF